MAVDQHLLTTDEVARLLGVKSATVYAYVSRGLLTSRRNAAGKGSLFDREEVQTFLAARKPSTTPAIRTGVSLIKDGALYYRGWDVHELARTASFEAVANLLWTGDLEHVDLVPHPDVLQTATDAVEALPDAARLTDRLRVIVAAAAAADPLRFDTSPPAVVATGRALLATMAIALPSPARPRWGRLRQDGRTDADRIHRERAGQVPLADILWHRFAASEWEDTARTADSRDGDGPTELDHLRLNAALILLADHDIAASTLAARIAASTRAHPYAVVSAGLAALDGPLHGAASGLTHQLLTEAMDRSDPLATIADRLREDGSVPGFGHPLYPDGDPRATTLLGLLGDGPVRDCAAAVADAMRVRSGAHPNVDFALAALTVQYALPADAGEAIFAIARTAGWLAHALEEYADRPSRFRPSGRYAGRLPTS